MGKRRHYSDEERAEALAVLDANAGNLKRTARDLDIPRATLQEWAGGALEATARRETLEETGVAAGDLVPLGSIIYKKSRKEVHGFGRQARRSRPAADVVGGGPGRVRVPGPRPPAPAPRPGPLPRPPAGAPGERPTAG
jgi:8-oxo-dGTP pyrophosphatase MutT (NUDIX family)